MLSVRPGHHCWQKLVRLDAASEVGWVYLGVMGSEIVLAARWDHLRIVEMSLRSHIHSYCMSAPVHSAEMQEE